LLGDSKETNENGIFSEVSEGKKQNNEFVSEL
jgi:hypothetical protein